MQIPVSFTIFTWLLGGQIFPVHNLILLHVHVFIVGKPLCAPVCLICLKWGISFITYQLPVIQHLTVGFANEIEAKMHLACSWMAVLIVLYKLYSAEDLLPEMLSGRDIDWESQRNQGEWEIFWFVQSSVKGLSVVYNLSVTICMVSASFLDKCIALHHYLLQGRWLSSNYNVGPILCQSYSISSETACMCRPMHECNAHSPMYAGLSLCLCKGVSDNLIFCVHINVWDHVLKPVCVSWSLVEAQAPLFKLQSTGIMLKTWEATEPCA